MILCVSYVDLDLETVDIIILLSIVKIITNY